MFTSFIALVNPFYTFFVFRMIREGDQGLANDRHVITNQAQQHHPRHQAVKQFQKC